MKKFVASIRQMNLLCEKCCGYLYYNFILYTTIYKANRHSVFCRRFKRSWLDNHRTYKNISLRTQTNIVSWCHKWLIKKNLLHASSQTSVLETSTHQISCGKFNFKYQQIAVGGVTWPCLQRRGPPSEGPAHVSRTAGVAEHVFCLLLVIIPAQRMEGYKKQVPPRAQSPARQFSLIRGLNMLNIGCTYCSVSP